MSDNVIEIRGIIRDFKLGQEIVHVLKGIDLDIKRGEYVAIMGPSGSGKSTLMNLLGCLDTPTAGMYKLNGKDVSQMTDDELADIRNTEIVHTEMDGSLMMMSIEAGKYYELNVVSKRIWELIEAPVSLSDIVNQLLTEFEISESECLEEVQKHILELESKGIIHKV